MTEAKLVPCQHCGSLNRIPLDKVSLGKAHCGSCKTTMSISENVFEVTLQQLDAIVANSPVPVVVDFWAPWCGPCVGFAPVYKSQADAVPGKALYLKVNTEKEQSATQQFGFRGIPTLIGFKNGKEAARQSGALPAPVFRQWMTQLLS